MAYKTSSFTFIIAAGFFFIAAALVRAKRHYVSAVSIGTQTTYPLHEQVSNGLNIFLMVAEHTLQLDTLNNVNLRFCPGVSY